MSTSGNLLVVGTSSTMPTLPSITISPSIVLGIIVLLVFFVWLLYSIVMAYHWLRYSHRSKIGIPLFAAHIVISILLFIIGISGFI